MNRSTPGLPVHHQLQEFTETHVHWVLTIQTLAGKVMSLLFNMLSRLVMAFLPRSKCLLISWLQSLSAVILEPKKIKSDTVSTVSPSICHEVMGPDAMILVFECWVLIKAKSNIFGVFACMLSCFSRVWLFATLWSVARKTPLSMEFSRQEYWSGLPCAPPEDLPDPGIKPESPRSPELGGGFFTTSATWETHLGFIWTFFQIGTFY